MDEDEYLEEEPPVQESSSKEEVVEETRVESHSDIKEAMPEAMEIMLETDKSSELSEPSTSAAVEEMDTSTPSSTRRGGRREKSTRARKCVAKPNLGPPKTISMDDVYAEAYGAGYARCYPGYKQLKKEQVVTQLDAHLLAKIQASATKLFDKLTEKEMKKEKKEMARLKSEERPKRERRHHEDSATPTPAPKASIERSASPARSRKSLSRGVSEAPSIQSSRSIREASREKSEVPALEEKKAKKEEKDEKKLRKQMEKEQKRREKQEAAEKATKEAEKKKRKSEGKLVDITYWDEEKIAAHFGLQKIVLEIPSLSQEVIDAALAIKSERAHSPERRKRSPPLKRARFINSDSSRSPSPLPKKERRRIPEFDDHPLGDLFEDSSLRSLSPGAKELDVRKKSKSVLRKCVNCLRDLHECVDQWYMDLGAESQYCSFSCIEGIVTKIREKENFHDEMRIPMLGVNGLIRRDHESPTVDQLAQYLRQSSSFVPLCLSEKADEMEKKEKDAKAKANEKASKFMSKESDLVRQNLRGRLGQCLFHNGRIILKSTMAECKSKGEDIEKELFKSCRDVNSPKYKLFSEKLIPLLTQHKTFASKVNAGYISTFKLINLDPEEFADFAKISNTSLNDDENPDPIKLPTITVDQIAANQEIAKHIPAAPPLKMGRIPKKPKGSVSTLDAILGNGVTDTTSQHNSHFYDANCQICAGKAKEKAEREKREMVEREKFREEERLKKEKRMAYEPKKPFDQEREGLKRFDGKQNVKSLDRSRKKNGPEGSPLLNPRDPLGLNNIADSPGGLDDDDYGGGGGGGSPVAVWKTPLPEMGKKKPDESWRQWVDDDEIWRGKFSMAQITFVTSLKAISNKRAFEMRESADLPAHLKIKGRIRELVIFDYLKGLRDSDDWDVITLNLEKPLDPEGERKFHHIYNDMITKERWHVIELEDNTKIKDLYLLPVRPNGEPPAILLPWQGPGIPKAHSEMLLLIVIRARHGTLPEMKASDSQQSKSPKQKEQFTPGLSEEARALLEKRAAELAQKNSEFLINPSFFASLKKPEQQPQMINPQAIRTLVDMLQYINETDNPKLIRLAVQKYFEDPTITQGEKEAIMLTVRRKISEKIKEKKSKTEAVPPAGPSNGQTVVEPEPVAGTSKQQEEYVPDKPNEPEDEEANDNDSTAGNEADVNSAPMSPVQFDVDQSASFMGMAGNVLAHLAPPPAPPVLTAGSTPSSDANLIRPPPVPPQGSVIFVPAPVPPADPEVPVPAPELYRELVTIRPPTPPQPPSSQPVGIPVISLAPNQMPNMAEAMTVKESPPHEYEDYAPPGQMPFYGRPPPISAMGAPPPPMGMPPPPFMGAPPVPFHPGMPPPPHAGMLPPHPGMPPHHLGMPPPNMGMPLPPMAFQPPPPPRLELHGSCGFRGLAPSLGGNRITGAIDYFNAAAAGVKQPDGAGPHGGMPIVAVPAGALTKPTGIMPGYGNSGQNEEEDSDDNIPRTPTPPMRPFVRPGCRPGALATRAMPGAPGRRVLPGARLPPRAPSPDAEELEIMEREERRRVKAIERELEAERKRKEREEIGARRVEEKRHRRKSGETELRGTNNTKLGKIPKNAPLAVITCRVNLIAAQEGVSVEEAERIVREQHMQKSGDEGSDLEIDDLAESRGIPTVRAPQKRKRNKAKFTKNSSFAYEHSTGSVQVAMQKRALNVDYDEQGNEVVPDDVPSSDEMSSSREPSPVRNDSAPPPPAKKAAPNPIDISPKPTYPMDRSKIPPLIPPNPIVLSSYSTEDMDISHSHKNLHDNPHDDTFAEPQWPPNQMQNKTPQAPEWNKPPPPSGPPPAPNNFNGGRPNHQNQNHYDPYHDDGFGYPSGGPTNEPYGRFPPSGRGQPQYHGRGARGMSNQQRGHPPRGFGGPPNRPPFRGRGAPNMAGPPHQQRPPHGGPSPSYAIPSGGTRGHPYYDMSARGRGGPTAGHWNAPRGNGSPARGGPTPPRGGPTPPRGGPHRGGPPPCGGYSSPSQPPFPPFHGGPPRPPPLAAPPPPQSPSNSNNSLLHCPPPPPPPPPPLPSNW